MTRPGHRSATRYRRYPVDPAAQCREGYRNAEGLLAHLDNVDPLLEEALQIADLTRLEIHGPVEELQKLREPLSNLNPEFYSLEFGFRLA